MGSLTIPGGQPVYGLPNARQFGGAPFNDSFLAGRVHGWWNNGNVAGRGFGVQPISATSLSGAKLYVGGGSAGHAAGMNMPAPAGSFTAQALLAETGPNSDTRAGMYVGVSGAKGHICGPFDQDNAFGYIGVTTISDTSDWSGYDGTLVTAAGTISVPNWFRIRWVAGTSTIYADYSGDGITWTNITSRGSMSQPTEMGIVIFSNGGGNSTSQFVTAYQWIVS